jgi:hypothetical protein
MKVETLIKRDLARTRFAGGSAFGSANACTLLLYSRITTGNSWHADVNTVAAAARRSVLCGRTQKVKADF